MFHFVKQAVEKQLAKLAKGELFVVDVDKDEFWELYLASFPEGTNPLFRERTEHDCSCCKNFIRNMGRVVSIKNNKLHSIWDVKIGDEAAAAIYQPVVDALSKAVHAAAVARLFRTKEPHYGGKSAVDNIDTSIVWDHFYYKVDSKFIDVNAARTNSDVVASHDVFAASMEVLTIDACDTVLDLIDEKALYRGEEHKSIVTLLRKTLVEADKIKNPELFYWEKSIELGMRARFKNTVIGTLLLDLSEGEDLEVAVAKFDSKMVGYKRTSAIVTKGMIAKAEKAATELGYIPAIPRRYAVKSDITVANVLYVDRSVDIEGNVFDALRAELPDTVKGKPKDILIDDFLADIPEGPLELMLPNHNNLMSLIAPVNGDAKNLLKWNNNFSWTYNGDVTDSMREQVKAKGGQVDGALRFSIRWNEEDDNKNDLDAHCREPGRGGRHIYYSEKRGKAGSLDVDIIDPKGVAVENIIFPTLQKMNDGTYKFQVHVYSDRGGVNFDAEIEFEGQIYSFSHRGRFKQGQYIDVADVTLKNGRFTIKEHMSSSLAAKSLWGVSTNQWTPVDMIMLSPNHWDGQQIGNKHIFFILAGCVNPDRARGLYNEFLSDELHAHRKVFEHLGAKMKTEPSEEQLSGVGYSSTISNSVLCKTPGGIYNIVFGEKHV